MEHSFKRAANGELAVEELRKAQDSEQAESAVPDILFLDLKMPVMSGFDVLAWIKARPVFGRLKVVVLSGSNDAQDRVRAAELGAAHYLVKPINEEQLREQMAGVTRSGRAQKEAA